MLNEFATLGQDWLQEQIDDIADYIEHQLPSVFNEQNRYLPDSVTPLPGFMRFDVNPFMREIIDCADPRSDVREVNLKKGVQITYTTLLESVLLYYVAYIKTRPTMMVSADKELVKSRIENNILPMLIQSDLEHLIKSADEGNSRKTGKTANHLQWEGGGFMIPAGANNADKMRSYSIMLMLKDEIDAWKAVVGKDGDPDELTDDRCSAFWNIRKIFRGSTPLELGSSKIQFQYLRGDQRKYMVLCRSCGFPQELRWETVNKETGIVGGFQWDFDDQGTLDLESVRYCCQNCGHEHFEHDKQILFATEHGAHWKPTTKPTEPGIRSYHLPSLYSPVGMQPWYKCVSAYLKGFDVKARKVIDVGKYQVFYNNILAEPFEHIYGGKVAFTSVSAHRRAEYRLGQIPNTYAAKVSGGEVLFLTCQVDVHKDFLAVAVFGWTSDSRTYVIEYFRIETEADETFEDINCSGWGKLREVIEERTWQADNGTEYRVLTTLIDAGYANDTVTAFCAEYSAGVYAILGRERPGKNQRISEFTEFTTQAGVVGYKITVDHYKDRMAPVLRRQWDEQQGEQKSYHFNAPIDLTDKQLKELTVETRKKKVDERGNVTYYWHRPSGARNELWDLLGYGHANVEIIAWDICTRQFELETVEWLQFWEYCAAEDNDAQFGRVRN